jgi:stress-induced morphogen
MAAQTDHAAAAEANSSGVTTESLTATLKEKLRASHVQVEDMSGGCGQAFSAIIVSDQFEKKTLLARHRLVNSVLKEEIAAIHAWTPKCLTPEQWEKQKTEMGWAGKV